MTPRELEALRAELYALSAALRRAFHQRRRVFDGWPERRRIGLERAEERLRDLRVLFETGATVADFAPLYPVFLQREQCSVALGLRLCARRIIRLDDRLGEAATGWVRRDRIIFNERFRDLTA